MMRATVNFSLVLALGLGLLPFGPGGAVCVAQWLDNGVTAHRGNSGEFPENTLPAFQSGIDVGADWLELDVYETLDGQIVVIHDSTTGRVADANISVAGSTYAELAELDVAYQFRNAHNLTIEECPRATIPLLSDVLQQVAAQDRTRVSIQPKMDCVSDIVNVIDNSQAAPWVGFNDGSLTYMTQASNLMPEATIFWDRSNSNIDTDIATATARGFHGLVINQGYVTQSKVDKIHAAGLEAGAWTVNDPATMRQLLDLGVDRIYTDYPRTLLDIQAERHIPGDANENGSVDVSDLGILATNYGTIGGAVWAEGDFTGDGNVDVSDLGILATNYGTTSPIAVPTAPLAAYWTFDDDYTSEVHNDFFEGSPQGGAYTSITHQTGQYKRGGGALKLDSGSNSGNGTYVDIDNEVAIPLRDRQITVSAWYKPSDISGDGSDERNFVWESVPGYSLSFSVGRDDDANWAYEGVAVDETGPDVDMDKWNHVVMVLDMDAERIQFYHNGQLHDDVSTDGSAISTMSGFHIGNHRAGDGARDFDGYIDDVAVYHGVLSPDAVAGLYDGSYSPLNVPIDEGILPNDVAQAVEAGWTLSRMVDFDNPSGIAINTVDGNVYVARRSAMSAGGGLFRVDEYGTAVMIVEGNNIMDVIVDPLDGDAFISEDYGGVVYRVAHGATARDVWLEDFNSGDDDSTGMAIVPDTYVGGLVTPGSALVTDRGSGGFEELWVWSLDGEGGEYRLVSDSNATDGVGNVFVDLLDVAVSDTQIFVADGGAGKIFEVTAVDTLSELLLSETIAAPRSIVFDPTSGDLLALCADETSGSVLRIDPATGDVSVVIDGLGGSTFLNWSTLDISADGDTLWVTDYANDRIYEFITAAGSSSANVPEPNTMLMMAGLLISICLIGSKPSCTKRNPRVPG